MRCYFKNVLNGFIPEDYGVNALTKLANKANFILVDIDKDDMPEIIMSLETEDGKKHWAIIDRKNYKWNMNYTGEQTDADEVDWDELLKPITVSKEWLADEAKRQGITLDDLITEDNVEGLAIVEDREYPIIIQKLVAGLNELFSRTNCNNIDTTKDYTYTSFTDADIKSGNGLRAMFGNGPANTIVNQQILADLGNVIGDGNIDKISLMGKKPLAEVNNFYTDMTLWIQDQTNNEVVQVMLPTSTGFNPTLQLIDVTGRSVYDVVVTVQDDASGQIITATIFSFANNNPQIIFDSNSFNDSFTGVVTFLPHYKVEVVMSTGLRFVIDITNSVPGLLNSIYHRNGQLKDQRRGSITGLTQIKFVKNGRGFNLVTYQDVLAGVNPLDVIGTIVSTFMYSERTNTMMLTSQVIDINGIQTR